METWVNDIYKTTQETKTARRQIKVTVRTERSEGKEAQRIESVKML